MYSQGQEDAFRPVWHLACVADPPTRNNTSIMVAAAHSLQIEQVTFSAIQLLPAGLRPTTVHTDMPQAILELLAQGWQTRVAAFREAQNLSHMRYHLAGVPISDFELTIATLRVMDKGERWVVSRTPRDHLDARLVDDCAGRSMSVLPELAELPPLPAVSLVQELEAPQA